ncbi:MAG TPA: hypothetical protein VF739_12180 [Ktedonobacterales bacterium]
MIAEGLLWFDDDARRPLVEKIANAIERYAERTGWRATVCETHPTQVDAYQAEMTRAAQAAARKRPSAKVAPPAVTLPAKLRVKPNPAMLPNCFLIGIEAGETPRRAPSSTASHSASRRASRTKGERAVASAATSQPTPLAASAPPARATHARAQRAKASA